MSKVVKEVKYAKPRREANRTYYTFFTEKEFGIASLGMITRVPSSTPYFHVSLWDSTERDYTIHSDSDTILKTQFKTLSDAKKGVEEVFIPPDPCNSRMVGGIWVVRIIDDKTIRSMYGGDDEPETSNDEIRKELRMEIAEALDAFEELEFQTESDTNQIIENAVGGILNIFDKYK